MSGKYVSGGILAALHKTSTPETTEQKLPEKVEENENDEQNVLATLFTVDKKGHESEEEEEELTEDVGLTNEFESTLVEKVKAANDDDSEDETKKPAKKQKKTKIEESPERLERTLFVGNVALTVTKKTLRKLFNKFGELDTLRLRSFVGADPKTPRKVALIKKTFHAECQSMNAYIVYKDKESVGKALQCNGMVLEGLHIRVDRVTSSGGGEKKTKQCVFIGNLPFNVKDEALYEHFGKCGDIEAVRAVRDKVSGMGKGFGYVTFKSSDAVLFALKMHGTKLDGREIRVCRAKDLSQQPKQLQQQQKGGGKTLHGKNNNNNNKNENSFMGLKSTTSKRDRELGKRLVQTKQTKSNAMRRIQGKKWEGKKKEKKGKDMNKANKKTGKGEKAKGRARGSK